MTSFARVQRIVLVAILAAEGLLLLRPEGALVHAARGRREPVETEAWWRNSPVHMGCSIATCRRPATRTASYHLPGPRGSTWRAYGFCEKHDPPRQVTGLVYRLGRPATFDYDVPLAPIWAEAYFLLGMAAFGLWCAGIWKLAAPMENRLAWLALFLVHAGILVVLWRF
ncbi:MAG: hypothetical protein LAP40_28555 [Acidobacteriia bacterium]|nr:hypothetical protein [Terriglobia bacterium]